MVCRLTQIFHPRFLEGFTTQMKSDWKYFFLQISLTRKYYNNVCILIYCTRKFDM